MTSINHSNNLSFVTLHFPSSTPPSSSTSSTGWTDKITKKIKELTSKLESLKNLKNAKNGYLSEKDSKSLDSLPTQLTSLETVHKLAEFAEQLDTTKTNNKNILNNLCTGLEKFLGFNSETKGYTGQGIVYSDLDRLCERGVMGFLYYLLKDVSEKQPYAVGKNELISIVEMIKTKLSTGREGFKVIAQVADRVREYNERVKESNEKVKNKIQEMQEVVGKPLTDKLRSILLNDDSDLRKALTQEQVRKVEQAVTEADQLVKDYATKGTDFINGFREKKVFSYRRGTTYEYRDEFKDLNPDVQHKITDAIKTISYEATRLGAVSTKQKSDLDEMTAAIKDTFRSLKKCVTDEIGLKVHALVSELVKIINSIWNSLKDIAETLRQYITELVEWIIEADKIMTEAIKGAKEIESKNPGWKNQLTIEGDANELKNKGEQLYQKFESAKQKVENNVKTALGQVKDMDDALKKDLKKVKEAVEAKVTGIKDAIGKLGEHFKDFASRKPETTQKIMDNIKNEVAGIRGKSGIDVSRPSGLAAAVYNMKDYVRKYGNAAFDAKVKEWIKNILDENVLVKIWWGKYVTDNAGRLKAEYENGGPQGIAKDQTDEIAEQITTQLVPLIKPAQDKIKVLSDKVGNDVKNVRICIDTFVAELDGKLQTNHITEFVSPMVDAIEGVVKLDAHVITYTDNLKSALFAFLPALSAKARQASRELQSFALTGDPNLAAMVQGSLTKAEELVTKLEKAMGINDKGQPRGTENPAAAVDDAIEGVSTTLNEEIGRSDSDKVTLPGNEKLSGYKEYIKQDHLAALTSDDFEAIKEAGSLPAAIGAIRDKANEDFEAAKAAINEVDSFTTLSEKIKQNLTALLQAFSTKGMDVKTALQKLKDEKIGKKLHGVPVNSGTLQKIYNDMVTILREHFEPVIKSTTALMKVETDRFRHECTQSLTRHVDTESQEATNKLITQANKNYVTSVKDMLQAFADKVQKELKPLPGDIDTDRQHGFKGFMRTLQGRIGDDGGTSTDNVDKLKTIAETMSQPNFNKKETFQNLSKEFRKFYWGIETYVKQEIKRVNGEENKKKNPPGQVTDTYVDKFLGVGASLTALLEHISGENKYDHRVPGMLDDLLAAISKVKPTDFSKPNTPTMDSISAGLHQFVEELKKVYISAYDGQEFEAELVANPRILVDTREPRTIYDQTDYDQKWAKVLFTIISVICNGFSELRWQCVGNWKTLKSNLSGDNNPLGMCFKNAGYIVPESETVRNGDLRNNMTGQSISDKLKETLPGAKKLDQVKNWKTQKYGKNIERITVLDILDFLYDCLETYYRVCHVTTSSSGRHPSSVYDMLLWLTGLTHNRVYTDLTLNGFEDLFEKPKDDAAEANSDGDIAFGVEKELSLEAYPQPVTAPKLREHLRDVCVYAEDILVAILGHGHSEGRYACDFNTNPDKFAYPSDPSKCLDMLFEILLRLQEQLYLLYMRCRRTRDTISWRDCWYGRGVGGSSWKCNAMQCPEQIANQNADQIHKQTCNQNCNQTAECGLKSPLQSFLEDGLPGFMPHPYSKADCKMTCSLSNHRGIPCKTPMGFSDLSVMASRTSKGDRIVEALRDFCGSKHSPLSQLCSLLLCLLNRPPQTLGDMFAFYYNFISDWNGKGSEHKSDAFDDAVNQAYFGALYEGFIINNVFDSKIHGEDNHKKGDLFGLVDCYSRKGDRTPKGSCGPYMRPISGDIRNTFSSKHAGTYLSWIVYITETFYDLLKKLFEECNKCCGEDKPKCRAARCSRNCNFNGKQPSPNHADSCDSIVNCKFTRPTLYKYGFVHEDALMLADKPNKRTCRDFCKALKTVLSDKVNDDAPLAKLVFKTIPDFLFKIRAPFIWTTVALWLLSLLYLLHIMVIRLDLLHIKSHLHSPSSHRIAAQSLLAASRVNKLNRVFYLQP